MGPRLLKSFLGKSDKVNITNYVKNWKKNHPEQLHPDKLPTIVIDFSQFIHYIVDNMEKDGICGGRQKTVSKKWKEILTGLEQAGCELVFYSDLNLQEEKINTWLKRNDNESKSYEEIYQKIDEGKNLETIAKEVKYVPVPYLYGMVEIAQKRGKFHYAIKYECDRELAMYANKVKAIAIISDDMDFCIFQGSWKLWSCKEIKITKKKEVETDQYNREVFTINHKLSSYQLSLLATLAGNDLINEEQLKGYHDNIKGNRIIGIIAYVKKFHCNPSDIAEISRNVFGNKESQSLIEKSIKSYNTNDQLPIVDDVFEKQLLKIGMYRPYVSTKCPIQKLQMQFYDFSSARFPELLTEWLKRRMGLVLVDKSKDNNFTFTLLTKKEKTQPYKKYEETPIYPNFDVPGKDQLYLEADTVPLMAKKWEIFGWIVSLKNEEIFKIKLLKKKYWLTLTTLCIMVKNELIGKEEADGILYTENCVQNNKTANVIYPTVVVSKFVRAAHMYNVAFGHIRDCYDIAGLFSQFSHIQRIFQFDGVFFQKHMEEVANMKATQLIELYKPIEKYRIYA